jgi:hypothetical protein
VFSKIHLNTQKLANTKVVHLFEGHIFHNWWHLRFGAKNGEKAWSTPSITIHRRQENCKLGVQFMQIMFI